MAQNKILVDTNVYLRLAQSIHPLLKTPFGAKNYCLYILPELSTEYHNSQKLKNSFSWFTHNEYYENRNCSWHLPKSTKEEIEEAYKFIRDTSADIAPNVSRVDIRCLAYAYILKVPVATDDSDMIILAHEFEIAVLKMLQLLKLMLDNNYIDMVKIRSIAAYLLYLPDLPKDFKVDFVTIFKEDLPAVR